ncbi:aminoacyl-tRNA hydrolase [Sulfurospirillum arcachonense]|uniref:aminoacyl-tRNA hydrolase n=1 Tax=Sulfurospirillum arcachonense TaxID=57666 RepID=UPI000467FCEB|nr:aminoacyl-tRNA hydrolase [Sulfurospirillum arcachonense]
MTLIVGLGNPDSKYQNNRHNVGFMVIDKLVDDHNCSHINKSSFRGELFKSKNILFLKPHTYMNLSGESVRAVCDYYKPERIIVIHDDLDLPFGTLRYKIAGGHGGHNGLRSIDAHIGKDYYRVRIGIGKPNNKQDVANYVLSDFPKVQSDNLKKILEISTQATKGLINGELSTISSKYTLKENFNDGKKI